MHPLQREYQDNIYSLCPLRNHSQPLLRSFTPDWGGIREHFSVCKHVQAQS